MDQTLELVGAICGPFLGREVRRAPELAVLLRLGPFRQHRIEDRGRPGISRERHRRQRHAVIGLTETDDLVLSRRASRHVILTRDLEGGLHRF